MSPEFYIQLFLIPLSFLCHIRTGRMALSVLFKLPCFDPDGSLDDYLKPSISFVFGLLIHLTAVFFLLCAGASWPVSLFSPLLPALIRPGLLIKDLLDLKVKPCFNFLLWFAVILFLGISLFEETGGIKTVWINNYGDLTFHLGMISSFAYGGNFPPEYHIFPGETLSYPFMINLWSASLWWIHTSFYSLSLIFLSQWLAVWLVVYALLDGGKNRLIPWALLLGGGSYYFIYYCLSTKNLINPHSGLLISKGFPWTAFLTTIWTTQRTALLGAATLIVAVSLFHSYLKGEETNACSCKIAAAGLIFALSPLVHAHFVLVGILYVFVVLLSKGLTELFKLHKERMPGFLALPREFIRLGPGRNLIVFCVSLLPGVVFLPWLIGKAGIIKVIPGWMTWTRNADGLLDIVQGAVRMWLCNAPFCFLLAAILFFISKRRIELFAIAGIFIAANVFQIAVWEWDQVKIFIALYTVLLCVAAAFVSGRSYALAVLFVLLIIPALFESSVVLKNFKYFTVYTEREVEQAQDIKNYVNQDHIIAAKPDHNSPVTLTGRKLYYGYEGTLHSHGISYKGRKKIIEDPQKILSCRAENLDKICPDYILWTNREKKFWKGKLNIKDQRLKATPLPYLYKIR